MSIITRRRRRRSVVVASVVAGSLVAALATAMPAAAVGNGFDPHAAPVTIPGTSTVVTERKLAGQGFAQGVQVAPQWIIASGHAPAGVGSRFTNEYGTATVDRLSVCNVSAGCDISASHLSTPINAPSYPPLLLGGVPDEPGKTPAGDTLAVGNGGSTLGRPTAGWTQPTVRGTTLSTFTSPPSAVNGDSGGPAFYYRPGATTGVVQGLMTRASSGITSGLQQLTTDQVKPFLDNALPAGTVNWVTYDQLGPRRYRPEPIDNPTATATTDGITLTWPAATATPAATGYRAVLVRTDNVGDFRAIATPAGTRTATFTGLTPGVSYGAFVLVDNADGESAVPWVTMVSQPPNPVAVTYRTTVAASARPAGVTKLAVTTARTNQFAVNVAFPDLIPKVTQTEVLTSRCADGCSSLTQISDTVTTGAGGFVQVPANTPRGTLFQIQVRELNTAGASAWAYATAAYAPLAAPLPPASVTVTPNADGTDVVSFVPPPGEPTDAVVTGYQQHAAPESYEVRLHVPGQSFPETVDFLDAGQRSTVDIADFNLPAGSYTVEVLSDSGAWGNSAPVAATAVFGTVSSTPPPAVTTTGAPSVPRQPTNLVVPMVESSGATNTITWSEPAPGSGMAAPDGYVITMESDYAGDTPLVAEVPANQLSFTYEVDFLETYTVKVYAVSQQAGPSDPVTATGLNLGKE